MREFWLCAVTGIAMFAVGQVYGGKSQNLLAPERTAVDLPAALALEPHRYPDGSLSPDYKDAAILALQVALDRATDEYNALAEHDADVHRGAMVPIDYRCPE